MDKLFEEYKFDIVVDLAAQAGVRYSIERMSKGTKNDRLCICLREDSLASLPIV